MLMMHIRGVALLITVLVLIFFRKLELRYLCRIANKRTEEINRLTRFI